MGYSFMKRPQGLDSRSIMKMAGGLGGIIGGRSLLTNDGHRPITSQAFRTNGTRSFTSTKNKKKKMPKAKRQKPVTLKTVKKLMATQSEIKVKDASISASLTNGDVFSYNLTAQIVQGTTDGTRVGDELYLKSVEIRGFVASHTVDGAYAYRVIIGWSGEELNPGTLSTGGLSFSQVFMPNLGAATSAFGIVNKKAFTVVSDKYYDVNSQISGVTDLITTVAMPKCTGKYKYQANGNVYGKTRNLFIVVVGFLRGGVASAAAGSTIMNYALKYTDS